MMMVKMIKGEMDVKRVIVLLSIMVLMIWAGVGANSVYAIKRKPAPQKVLVKVVKNKSLKISWEKQRKVKGYIVYKYNNKSKKYISAKTINDGNKCSWIDSKVKKNKKYKYRVASFVKRKRKKRISCKSYWVEAIVCGKNGKISNVSSIDINNDSNITMGIFDTIKINSVLTFKKKKGARVLSKKVRWITNNNQIIKVNKKGIVKSTEKEGSCKVLVVAHNGLTKTLNVKVKNYANPKSFSKYTGYNSYINYLLMNYKNEICHIATFFTQYGIKSKEGTIKLNKNKDVVGLENISNIDIIEKDIRTLLFGFPLVIKINYKGTDVGYKMEYDASGVSFCEVRYSKEMNFEESPLLIEPHWIARQQIY